MAGIRALLGLFPKTGDYESRINKLDEEYNKLLAFKNSKELRDFRELEAQIKSNEFITKRNEILSLKFNKTEDYQKEKNYRALTKARDIRLYYKTKNSENLRLFQGLEKSKDLKRYYELEKFVSSEEFVMVKRDASLSSKEKFNRSDLAKTLQQYESQRKSSKISSYYKFLSYKNFNNYISTIDSGTVKKVQKLEKETETPAFKQKIASLSKADRNTSAEYQKLAELSTIKNSRGYKNYLELAKSTYRAAFDELYKSAEIEAFEDLSKFVTSDEFKKQKREIETRSFKDTTEYSKLQEFISLKKSKDIKFYFEFKDSKELKNYLNLDGSQRIKDFEELESYIKSDEFNKFKSYCLKSPKKRWTESKEYGILQDYELKRKSDTLVWYFENYDHKRYAWHRAWSLTFHDDFSSAKLDNKKWLTRYFWGDKMLKESYSLSQDKHFVTDGKNLSIENNRLLIATRRENCKGKSWHPENGFITRDFGYTSGLINSANSHRQKYGIFEAKIKISPEKELQNAFWMIGKTMLPHIDIMKASKKLSVGNSWGDPRNIRSVKQYSSSRGKGRFASDYFIYTLEWAPGRLAWKINGVEIAASGSGVPDEDMYMVLSAGLHKEVSNILPSIMEIDWVKCYQQNDRLK